MEESFKDLIIVILTFVLLYLIYNKLIKRNIDTIINSTRPIIDTPVNQLYPATNHVYPVTNQVYPVTNQIYPVDPIMDQMKLVDQTNQSRPASNQVYPVDPIMDQMKLADQTNHTVKQHNSSSNVIYDNGPRDTYKDACMNNGLLSINSNGLSDDDISSNMSDHELIHIDNNKPFITNEEINITNVPELNAVQLELQNFNYIKEFDEENFNYYDPIGLYKGLD